MILLYTHSFSPNIGGVETYVMLLAKGLAKRYSEHTGPPSVTVVTATQAEGFEDHSLPFAVMRRPAFSQLLRLIQKADVVHLAGPCLLPLALALVLRKHVVMEHHGYQACCPNGLLLHQPTQTVCPGHFLQRRYGECVRCERTVRSGWRSVASVFVALPRRWLCTRVTANLCITDHLRQRLGLPRSCVVYYGIPEQTPVQRPAPGAITFAYVGRLVSEKGLGLLLAAAKRLADEGWAFSLKFVGDGPLRPELEQETRQLGLVGRVQFTGFLSGESLQAAMDDVAVVVMPSVWEETAGLAAMEQMMRGRLVIAADIGGLSEVVGSAGLKFRPGDAGALADCEKRVLEHPEVIAELGSKAHARAIQLFRDERMVEEHLRLYRELLPVS